MTSDLDQKISIITKHPILFLIGIGIVGFLVRMYYFPSEIPIIHDSIDYFFICSSYKSRRTFSCWMGFK